MSDREDARCMLELAKVDLKAIQNMLDSERFEDTVFGFHAQQAVEKALKSWLSLRGIVYPKTHDLRVLLRLLDKNGEADLRRFVSLVDLTDFGVQFRYDFPLLPAGIDRRAVLSHVESIIFHVGRQLRGTGGVT